MKNLLSLFAVLSGVMLASAHAADDIKKLPVDDQFLVKAISSAIAETKLADTVIDRSENPDVKQFAQTLKDDHTHCLNQLMAQAHKDKLSVVEGLDKDQKETANQLDKLEGDAFDQAYLRGVIQRHEEGISCLEAQIKDGTSVNITAICNESLPKVKKHLAAARKLQESKQN